MHFVLACCCFLLICAVSAAKMEVARRNLSADENVPTLKECAPFPIGNVWSSGLSAWGHEKGTDLGGPNNIFKPETYDDIVPLGWDWSTIKSKDLNEEREHAVLEAEFNSISSEVALKPHNIATGPGPNDFDFAEGDAMMAFAEENGMRVHGHTLLFHMSVPQWAREYEKNGTWNSKQWEDWLENYIKTVVGRYKGRIASWDVLNEPALMFSGGIKKEEMFWWRVIGDGYIEKAFRWAAEADPTAKLFINDNMFETFPSKLRDVLDLANDLRSRGIRVDGIGFQSHVPDGLVLGGYERHKKCLKAASDEGYLVHMSELDVCVNMFGLFQGTQSYLLHWIQRQSYNNIARAYLDGVASGTCGN